MNEKWKQQESEFTKHDELKRKLIYFSICSRLFLILLSSISNYCIVDHEAGVFTAPIPFTSVTLSLGDHIVDVLLGGLARWDGQYFVHICSYGYTYENTLAFFPLYPFFTKFVALILQYFLSPLLSYFSLILLSAVIVNIYFFVSATIVLYNLTFKVFGNVDIAYKSALFFCVNPASIFFTAVYSESCFAFLSFSGMLYSLDDRKSFLSCIAFGLSACTRSNGILNIGFIVHKVIRKFIECYFVSQTYFDFVQYVLINLILLVIYVITCLTPFLIFQVYAYQTFCFGETQEFSDLIINYAQYNKYVLAGTTLSPWCNQTLPLSYSYVQNHYWSVGFMKYYEWKQVPNFILALPIAYIILTQSYIYFKLNKTALFSLGFVSQYFVDKSTRSELFVFVTHAVLLIIFCILCIHVQVTTRMISSSSPLLYWFVALQYKSIKIKEDWISRRFKKFNISDKNSVVENSENMASVWKVFILTEKSADFMSVFYKVYFMSYFLLGTILFSNFYPWT